MNPRGPTLLVAAGVVIESGRVLVSRRKSGTHLAGVWEFPGGKVEPGEDPKRTVARELAEELGIDVVVGEIVEVTFHAYPKKDVLLLFYAASRVEGSPDPRPIEVAEVRWADVTELGQLEFPPADLEVLRRVRERLGRPV